MTREELKISMGFTLALVLAMLMGFGCLVFILRQSPFEREEGYFNQPCC